MDSDIISTLREWSNDAMGMELGDRAVLAEAADRLEAAEAQLKEIDELPDKWRDDAGSWLNQGAVNCLQICANQLQAIRSKK